MKGIDDVEAFLFQKAFFALTFPPPHCVLSDERAFEALFYVLQPTDRCKAQKKHITASDGKKRSIPGFYLLFFPILNRIRVVKLSSSIFPFSPFFVLVWLIHKKRKPSKSVIFFYISLPSSPALLDKVAALFLIRQSR
jgi:hypothetical protein